MNLLCTFTLLAGLLAFGASSTWGATNRVLFETRFEVAEGYDPELTLVGQQGWLGEGAGGNGLVTNFFAGEGQHAFVGLAGPTNGAEFLTIWRPVNYQPGPTNPPQVRFSVLMYIGDSETTTDRDDFRWSIYNSEADRLFTLDFDNNSLGINYLLDDDIFVPTGWSFTNWVPYELEILMDFANNQWSAWLSGVQITTNLAVTTKGSPLNFGDADVVWAIRTPGKPGDNYMVFDNYSVVAEGEPSGGNPPGEVEAIGPMPPPQGGFVVRARGTPGAQYILEASSDLQTWSGLKTNTMPVDGFFDHIDIRKLPSQFYRLVER